MTKSAVPPRIQRSLLDWYPQSTDVRTYPDTDLSFGYQCPPVLHSVAVFEHIVTKIQAHIQDQSHVWFCEALENAVQSLLTYTLNVQHTLLLLLSLTICQALFRLLRPIRLYTHRLVLFLSIPDRIPDHSKKKIL